MGVRIFRRTQIPVCFMPVTPFFSAPCHTSWRIEFETAAVSQGVWNWELLVTSQLSLVGGCSPLEPDGAWASKKNLKVKWGCYPSYGWNTSHIVMFETSNSALAILKMSLAACIMDKSMICSTEFHQPHVRDQCGTSWDISKFLSLATSWCIFTKHLKPSVCFSIVDPPRHWVGQKWWDAAWRNQKLKGEVSQGKKTDLGIGSHVVL